MQHKLSEASNAKHMPTITDITISRYANIEICRYPDVQMSRCPDIRYQTPYVRYQVLDKRCRNRFFPKFPKTTNRANFSYTLIELSGDLVVHSCAVKCFFMEK